MTTEEKFNAAVNVIRSLPKNGSYQPSNELMLRFYAYFKQATQGACPPDGRPAFWDLVGRAKYDAWRRLDAMTRHEAMTRYVDELHAIVETMSLSDNVAQFLDAAASGASTDDQLDNLKIEDLQLIAGDVIERVRSQPNSPLASREASPSRLLASLSSTPPSSTSISPTMMMNDGDEDDEDDDGEYVDTIDTPLDQPSASASSSASRTNKYQHHNGNIPTNHHISRAKTQRGHNAPQTTTTNIDADVVVTKAVQQLRADLDALRHQLNRVEQQVVVQQRKKTWCSSGGVGGVSLPLLAFIVTWPFIVNLMLHRLRNRR